MTIKRSSSNRIEWYKVFLAPRLALACWIISGHLGCGSLSQSHLQTAIPQPPIQGKWNIGALYSFDQPNFPLPATPPPGYTIPSSIYDFGPNLQGTYSITIYPFRAPVPVLPLDGEDDPNAGTPSISDRPLTCTWNRPFRVEYKGNNTVTLYIEHENSVNPPECINQRPFLTDTKVKTWTYLYRDNKILISDTESPRFFQYLYNR